MADLVSPFLQPIIGNLASLIVQEIGIALHLKTRLKRLESTLSTIEAVVRDIEKLETRMESVKNWLNKIKDAASDANNVVDEVRRAQIRRGVIKQGIDFFSHRNPLALRFKIGNKLKKVDERLEDIASETKYHLIGVVVNREIGDFDRRRPTSSFLTEPEVYGRDEAPPATSSPPIVTPATTTSHQNLAAPVVLTEANVYGQAASNLVAGDNFEEATQQILDFGGETWERDIVVRALRAASNNPERAVEYLYSGIPEYHISHFTQPAAPYSGPNANPLDLFPQGMHVYPISHCAQPAVPYSGPNANPLDLFPHGIPEYQISPCAQPVVPYSRPNANPLDMFPQGMPVYPISHCAQPAVLYSRPYGNPLGQFPQGVPSIGSDYGVGPFDFLRNNQQFHAWRTMLQANPQMLGPMLQDLANQNPPLMRLIQDNQADFLRLINEPNEGADGNILGQQHASAMPQGVIVSPEEREAIERLEATGFDRAIVLEVFFACNKNEELAGNYLFDHVHEFED